jgi:tetratricopeptide (TPR) repeat protein
VGPDILHPLMFLGHSLNLSTVESQDPPTISTGFVQQFMVPYQRNRHFTGRDELLELLHDRLCEKKPKQYNHRIALYGLGGVGKTQVALEYIYRYQEYYDTIYWISGADEAALLSGFQEIARRTGCVELSLKPADVALGVLTHLHQQRRWLFIIDNLDDESLLEGYLPEIRDGGHTLITTRNQDVLSIPAEGFEVGILRPVEAAELLCTRSQISQADSPAYKDEAMRIVGDLGYLPLAIEQAAAYIREASKDLLGFRLTYLESRRDLHRRIPHGNWAYSSSVATTWSLSFDVIEKKNPSAAKLLQLFAFLNPDLISIDFLRTGKGQMDVDLQPVIHNPLALSEALFSLEQFSLIKRSNGGQCISIHRLLQAVIQDEMSQHQLNEMWGSVINLCNASFPQDVTSETFPQCRQYQDLVLVPLTNAPPLKSCILGKTLYCVGKFLAADGKLKQAEDLARKAVQTLALDGDHPEALRNFNLLACIYWYQGRLEDSANLHEKVLETRSRVLGSHHPDTLKSMNNLALTHRYKRQYDQAAKLQEQALIAFTRAVGDEHPDTMLTMNALGSTYRDLRRLGDARRLHERAVALRNKVLGEEHLDTLRSMSSLAATMQVQGDFDDSVKLYEEVLEVRTRVLGEEHPETFATMHRLGLSHWYRGEHDESVRLVQKALEARKRTVGDKHLDTLNSIKALEFLLECKGPSGKHSG